jgi:hypothetical protein
MEELLDSNDNFGGKRVSSGRKRQNSSWNQFKQYERTDKKAAIDNRRSHKCPTALRSKGKRDNKT